MQITSAHKTILVVGKSGSGKSSILNVLQDIKTFEENDDLQVKLKSVDSVTAHFGGIQNPIQITYIQLPEIDFRNDQSKNAKVELMNHCPEGVNLVIVALHISGRLDGSIQDVFKSLEFLFGASVYSKCRIVITHLNMLSDKAKHKKLAIIERDLHQFLEEKEIAIPRPYYQFEAEMECGNIQGLKDEILNSQGKLRLEAFQLRENSMIQRIINKVRLSMRLIYALCGITMGGIFMYKLFYK